MWCVMSLPEGRATAWVAMSAEKRASCAVERGPWRGAVSSVRGAVKGVGAGCGLLGCGGRGVTCAGSHAWRLWGLSGVLARRPGAMPTTLAGRGGGGGGGGRPHLLVVVVVVVVVVDHTCWSWWWWWWWWSTTLAGGAPAAKFAAGAGL